MNIFVTSLLGCLSLWMLTTSAFSSRVLRASPNVERSQWRQFHRLQLSADESESEAVSTFDMNSRRTFVSTLAVTGVMSGLGFPNEVVADEGEDAIFSSIAARASVLSQKTETSTRSEVRRTDKTIYDFTVPVEGKITSVKDLIRQEYNNDGDAKVKAIVVVNIKQDDIVARKIIPELIALASKYGRTGELVIFCVPTDQGYFEPDTSALIRLKLASEYGYGINPSTVLTDKINLLGTSAHPLMRWVQSNCRTPSGLGRIQGNFEKFLLDGKTGLPVRRYPRKYRPLDMSNDIEALLAGKPLPPAGANWLEKWREAGVEAERDTYRFEKGLNVFDQ